MLILGTRVLTETSHLSWILLTTGYPTLKFSRADFCRLRSRQGCSAQFFMHHTYHACLAGVRFLSPLSLSASACHVRETFCFFGVFKITAVYRSQDLYDGNITSWFPPTPAPTWISWCQLVAAIVWTEANEVEALCAYPFVVNVSKLWQP